MTNNDNDFSNLLLKKAIGYQLPGLLVKSYNEFIDKSKKEIDKRLADTFADTFINNFLESKIQTDIDKTFSHTWRAVLDHNNLAISSQLTDLAKNFYATLDSMYGQNKIEEVNSVIMLKIKKAVQSFISKYSNIKFDITKIDTKIKNHKNFKELKKHAISNFTDKIVKENKTMKSQLSIQ